jgi:hypothetical protein
MTDEFKILVHRNGESAHLKLMGEFDEKAATQLIDTIRCYSRGTLKIFIHTDSLDGISDYDEQRFNNGIFNGSNSLSAKIFSTGRYSNISRCLEGRPN